MSRTLTGDAIRTGAMMPEGQVVAALFDPRSGDYLALSRPTGVTQDARAEVVPAEPRKSASDLLVRLERPALVTEHDELDVELAVTSPAGESRGPDVVIPTIERLYAIWFGLESAQVTLEARSPRAFLSPETLVLRPGKVESFRGALRPLPDVEVTLDLPNPLASSEDLELEVVLDAPLRKSLRKIPLPRGTETFRIENVAARPVDLVLHAPPWIFHEPVDLSDGHDAVVTFAPRPIHVDGTVTLGGRETRATVEFQTNRQGDLLAVEAGEDGFYEALLFRAGYYVVRVRLPGREGVAHVELLDRPIREDATLDFEIPANRFTVRVIDTETGEGIEGAEVFVGNKHTSMGGPLRTPGGVKQTTLRIVTEGDGTGTAPPLHPGTFTLSAKAENYMPSGSIEHVVDEGDEGRELTIAMRPVEISSRLRVLLPDGRPAAGAEARIQASLGDARLSWSGRVDSEGLIGLPEGDPGDFLLIRQPAAGFLVRPLPPSGSDLTWTLETAVTPLAVEVTRSWEEPARWVRIALRIGNRWEKRSRKGTAVTVPTPMKARKESRCPTAR